jgi:glycosyltransferase involved in cell wall biosynthesis
MAAPVTEVTHINLARGFRGGERQTQLLMEQLSARGVRQRLVARRGEALAGACAGLAGVEVCEVAGNAVSAVRALGDTRLVHVHQGRSLQAAYLNYLVRKTPYLVTRRVQKGPRKSLRNRVMYRRAAALITVSEAIGASLRALDPGLSPGCIHDAVSEFSCDAGESAAIRARIGGEFLVGHIGALDDSHKGQLQIIALARRLAQRAPTIRFVLVGSGRDESNLRRAADGLANVAFAGQVSNVGDYLAAFDAFIFPSRHEGLGSVLLDAMSFGLPVVASNVGGIPEIVEDQVNGMLCDVDDIDALLAGVMALFDRPGLREWMVEKNRETAQNYSASAMAENYLSVYERITRH